MKNGESVIYEYIQSSIPDITTKKAIDCNATAVISDENTAAFVLPSGLAYVRQELEGCGPRDERALADESSGAHAPHAESLVLAGRYEVCLRSDVQYLTHSDFALVNLYG